MAIVILVSILLISALVLFAFFPIRPSWFLRPSNDEPKSKPRTRRRKSPTRKPRAPYSNPTYPEPFDDYDDPEL
ncbi:MAG: hypothetical protein FWE38_04090 [Firmicutes bacterium]|nr:hypothetical protein [Bacillota bacterium]